MAKDTTFKVSKQGIEPIEVNFAAPESLDDPRWNELVSNPSEINDLAVQNLVIKIQSGARSRLTEGAEAVQNYVNNYKYGARQSTGTRKSAVKLTTADTKQAKFSKEQLEMLRAAGVQIED